MKTDNNKFGTQAKIEIRRKVLAEIMPSDSKVLDVFCGQYGRMYDEVWNSAVEYVGIDFKWSMADKRKRFVGDIRVFLKWLDLQAYNIFDVDAYGSPWEILETIAKKRNWSKNEKGAIVFTDCDMRPNHTHNVMGVRHSHKLGSFAFDRHKSALDNWIASSRVKITRLWQLKVKNPPPRWYCGFVFTGLGR